MLHQQLPKETNEEDLAKHEYHERQDLVFKNKDFESQGTPEESFKQQEHRDQVSEKDFYELDHKFEMAKEGFEILREVPGVDESEPQPLPNFPSLDANLGDKRGTDPPINPYSPSSFRM
ncbi:hypothetical protein Tco_0588577 [Tanacetum coccineum]